MAREVRVGNDQGLHARPAARLAKEAQGFKADIRLVLGDLDVDAKSILDILSLAAAKGTELIIKAHGEDAEEPLDHLEAFFDTRMGEES